MRKEFTMRYSLQCVVVAFLIIGISGCCAFKGHKEKCAKMEAREAPAEKVSLSQVPEPAKAEIEKLTAGGEIMSIEKETEKGKTIYDVEAKVGDKDVEYDVAECGTVLTSEESVPFDSLPADVKTASEKYFGSAQGLKASKEMEKGKTFYEVEGTKAGSKVTLKLSEKGKILEEEK
jgi:uncharacterized membrane protein YkoI